MLALFSDPAVAWKLWDDLCNHRLPKYYQLFPDWLLTKHSVYSFLDAVQYVETRWDKQIEEIPKHLQLFPDRLDWAKRHASPVTHGEFHTGQCLLLVPQSQSQSAINVSEARDQVELEDQTPLADAKR